MESYYLNYLQHHGILGQKWGKRNGPPYPLGESDKSAKEKSLESESKKKYNKDESEKHGLSDRQKKAIKTGAKVAVATLAAIGAYQLYKSGKLDDIVNVGKSKINDLLGNKDKAGSAKDFINFGEQKAESVFGKNTETSINGFKRLSKPDTIEEAIKNVNPNRGNPEYINNCSACGIATYLRTMGYDVTAKDTGGKPQILGGVVEECFKDAKVFDGSAVKFGRSRKDAEEMLLKRFGNDASGVVSIDWKSNNNDSVGHIFNWAINNGIVRFFDGQSGTNDAGVSAYWNRIDPNGSLTIARLDDAQIIFDAIGKYVENR